MNRLTASDIAQMRATRETYQAAFDKALEARKAELSPELPAIQRDAITESIRRDSAREVDITELSAIYRAILPDLGENDAKELAAFQPRLSRKPVVLQAAVDAFRAHGLDGEELSQAIDLAMATNAPHRPREA